MQFHILFLLEKVANKIYNLHKSIYFNHNKYLLQTTPARFAYL